MSEEEISYTFQKKCPKCGSENIDQLDGITSNDVNIFKVSYSCEECNEKFIVLELT